MYEEIYEAGTSNLEKRELNIKVNGMNFAKYLWDEANNWQLHYHLLDHLGSRQVVCDASE